jgi:peptide/nickel transport system permease protein
VAIFILRRMFWALGLGFAVTLILFVVFFVLPSAGGPGAHGRAVELGLQTQFDVQGSFGERYVHFLDRIVLHADLGRSTRSEEPVTTVIGHTLPVTASLLVGGALLWLLIAIPVGLLSALRPRSLLDRGLMVLVLVGVSAHPVTIGLIFSYLLGVKAHAFPIAGYCDLHYHADSTNFCGGPSYWAYHLFLPWLTFALIFAALYARMIRSSLLETLGEDYVRTARAKGAGSFRVMRTHVFRNALLPVVTMLGMDVGIAFAGALFIETIFSLPGMGQLLVHSIAAGDLPIVLGIALTVSLAVVIANLLVDIACSLIDPRIRLRGKGESTHVSRAVGRELRAQQPRVSEPATDP